MENNQEKKEYTLIEKEDEFNLSEEDLKKIAGGYYSQGSKCPSCGGNNTTFVTLPISTPPFETSFYQCLDCYRQFK